MSERFGYLARVLIAALVGGFVGARWTANVHSVPAGNAVSAGAVSGQEADGRRTDRSFATVDSTSRMSGDELTSTERTHSWDAVTKTDQDGLSSRNPDTANNFRGSNIKRSGSSVSDAYSLRDDWANLVMNLVSRDDQTRRASGMHSSKSSKSQNASITKNRLYDLNEANDEALTAPTRIANVWYVTLSESPWPTKAAYDQNAGVTGSYGDYLAGRPPLSAWDQPASTNLVSNPIDYRTPLVIDSPNTTTGTGWSQSPESPSSSLSQGPNTGNWNDALVDSSAPGSRNGSFPSRGDLLQPITSSDGSLPSLQNTDMGFRFVTVPEPATLAILALGALGMFARRRRMGS